MASINNSKTLFFITSPRSPVKLLDELKLLEKIEGKKWDKKTQEEYAELLLKELDTFKKKPKDPTFTARDRITRAPKSLGLVDLEPTIKITLSGKRLDGELREETFIKQLLKFQLPSPYHRDKNNRFNVKPYLEIIRLIYDLDGLTKTEMQLFGMQLTNTRKYDEIKNKIENYREQKMRIKQGKKQFDNSTLVVEYEKIYSEELDALTTEKRLKFLYTKIRNARDYADACFRYLLFTGLLQYDFETSELQVKEESRKEVKYFLDNTPREIILFTKMDEFKEYLFDADSPALFWDVPTNIMAELERIGISYNANETIESLKQKLLVGWKQTYERRIQKEAESLSTKNDFGEVFGVFESIMEKNSELIEPNLFLEWNTWRAFVILDDGEIKGNFLRDRDGHPISTAMGGKPDIECDYHDFGLIVEVTRSSGARQYEMEGEPVARHLGMARKNKTKPIYCVFIPINLHPYTLTHFFTLLKYELPLYGGSAEIVPVELEYFMDLLRNWGGKIESAKMKEFVQKMIVEGKTATSPDNWYAHIKKTCQDGI